jgi:hypothetical protein
MADFDVFNGDADGLCAVHQLRLAEPRRAELITGVKRDVRLLSRVQAQAGDNVAVFDVSLAQNCADLQRLLTRGVHVRYFDHHFAGDIPVHPLLEPHIDTDADVCTSSIVDRLLQGRFRAWAVTAAFGDNLQNTACELAKPLCLSDGDLGQLRMLGECLNYNSYGESEADLYYPPAVLYRSMAPFRDPLAFVAERPEVDCLDTGMREDLDRARRTEPTSTWSGGEAYVLPSVAWCRRVAGTFANVLAREEPSVMHAVLAPRRAGGYTVSVRMAEHASLTAEQLCREFPTGGGRVRAAGINELPEQELQPFLARLRAITERENRGR